MNLTEHQAKKVLRDAGVRVPLGALAKSVEESSDIASDLNQPKFVVKAQIQAGGRAQGYFKNDSQSRGGIRIVDSIAQVKASASQMIGNVLVTEQTGTAGELVQSVYVEEFLQVSDEKYLALTIDGDTGSLVFIASNNGGVGIEKLAKQSPELIQRFAVDILDPVVPTGLSQFLGLSDDAALECDALLKTLLAIFIDKDATLIELNPIGLNARGELSVLDATIVWDDNALFRQGHEEQMIAYDHLPAAEFNAKCLGLNYVQLDGNVGIVSAGAGLAMAVLDALHDVDVKPANFLDVPPSASVATIRKAIEIVLSNDNVDVLLVNVIGGGIMRCDAIADALLLINDQQKQDQQKQDQQKQDQQKQGQQKNDQRELSVPTVVRLAGTNATLANQRLSASLPSATVTSDFEEAIEAVKHFVQTHVASDDSSPKKSWWQRVVKPRETSSSS